MRRTAFIRAPLAVEPGDDQRAPRRLSLFQRCRQPRAQQQRIRSDRQSAHGARTGAVTDALAAGREVTFVDGAGVVCSSGETPHRVEEMGAHASAFVDALGLEQVDVLGFSMGGYVAQSLVLQRPELVRKLILVARVRVLASPGGTPISS